MLEHVCRLIAADEYRHFKLFYDHMKPLDLAREKISVLRRLKIAAGRITESEDDELAFAYHCGNEPVGTEYHHERCIADYMGRAMGFYRLQTMSSAAWAWIMKSVGLPPRVAGSADSWRRSCSGASCNDRQFAASPPPPRPDDRLQGTLGSAS